MEGVSSLLVSGASLSFHSQGVWASKDRLGPAVWGWAEGKRHIVCCMNSPLGSLGNKFAAQRASLQLGREWEVLTGWPRRGIIWFWHECLTDCLGPDGKGGKSCSKKVVSKTELLRALI